MLKKDTKLLWKQFYFSQCAWRLKLDHFSICVLMDTCTGWTDVNLLYFPNSTEISSLEGLTFWCLEINQSKRALHGYAQFSWLEDSNLSLRCRCCLFLTCSCKDDLIFLRNVTSETYSKPLLKPELIQDC